MAYLKLIAAAENYICAVIRLRKPNRPFPRLDDHSDAIAVPAVELIFPKNDF